MASMKLTCAGCRGMLFLQTARRNAAFSSIAIAAYEQGWSRVSDRWFCSEDCLARAARDVTPVAAALTAYDEARAKGGEDE